MQLAAIWMGINVCRAGWLSGGMAVFVAHRADAEAELAKALLQIELERRLTAAALTRPLALLLHAPLSSSH